MIVLGLDISTSITAYTLINTELPQNDQLVKTYVIYLSEVKDLYVKSCKVREAFKELVKEHKVDRIIVEDSLQSFRRGLSSARTLSTLTRFNGMVCFLAEDILKRKVERVNVIHARSSIGIKLDRKSDKGTKDQVLEWVTMQPQFTAFDWPTKTLKSGPRKGKTILDKCCYDIADSAVMCFYSLT